MYTIGTAGHVDHGKSTLIQALTGIDPDRLREEKERGLTIDLGFAWLTLPDGREVSIVDVPGHERFIKNMLAGVGGIDLALLVIAADEGVMPQTREHLAIIDLLGIEHGVVALTKSDLVEPDFLELAQAEAEEALRGTTLETAPVVPCSGVTGAGLEALKAAISAKLDETPPRRDAGRPRLPIDRVFTMSGFGTVVTGTLIDGSLKVGGEVEVAPAMLRARIRGIQSHGRKVDVAPPGRRTAVNLIGLAVNELRRGMIVTSPGGIKPTVSLDVRLRTVRHLPRPIRHNLEITFHTGSAEVEGRLLLLDADEVRPGESAWAQVRLSEPIAVLKGDHFIIRDPNDTLGGGRIVDTHVRRHRRFHAATVAALEGLERGSPEDLLLLALDRPGPVPARDLPRLTGLEEQSAREALEAQVAARRVVTLDGKAVLDSSLVISAAALSTLTERARDVLSGYHQSAPLRRGMPREELRSRLGLPAGAFDAFLRRLLGEGTVREASGTVALAGHTPAPDSAGLARAALLLKELQARPYTPAVSEQPDDELLAYLEDEGHLVRTGDGVFFAAEAYREMTERIVAHLGTNRTVTLAQVRDMFSTSRKFAQSLLEHMDSQHITRRVGDERVLRGK
jgi:selenocysteine-specific elongation factor